MAVNPETQNPAGYKGYRGNRTGGGGGGGALGSVAAAVGSMASAIQRGSVSSGSVPPSAYGGAYSQYAPASSSSASTSTPGPSPQQIARRKARQRAAKQARKDVAKSRKRRSGQDVKLVKSVQRASAKISAKASELKPKAPKTAKPKAMPKLAGASASGQVGVSNRIDFKAPKFAAIDKGYKRVSTPGTNRRATGLPAAETAGKPGAAQVSARPRRGPQNGPTGATQAPPTAKKPRKVAKRLQKAVKRSTPAAEVPSVVPPKFRDEVAKYGKMLDPVVPKGMSGSEYLGKMIQFESGWNPSAQNPSGASGLGQFMPGTRETFKNEYGVDPYASPKQAIKAAAMHASGKYGHAPLYAGYNPGYSSTDPIPSVDGGKTVSVGGSGKPVPTKLKRTARQTIGKKPTKAILKGGKVVKDPKAGEKDAPSKADQRWGGAVGAIHAVLPKQYWADARGDKRTPSENAAVGGSSTSDHLTTNTNSFAADLPASDELAAQIAKNLGLPSHTGLQTIEKDGVRYQLIWQAPGHYDHVHLGAEVIDPGKAPFSGDPNIPIKGTKLAVKMPAPPPATAAASAGATALAGGTATAPASSGPLAPGDSKNAKAKQAGKRRYRNYSPYADSPEGYYSVDPETYAADPFLKRLADLVAAGSS